LCEGEDELFVKLLDFGIAKNAEMRERDITLDGETKTGQVVGTPFYMSPEQVTAQKSIDARSDLWALGVVTFEALTGQRPFDGPSFGALAVKIATGMPPRPSSVNAALPVSFDAWFAKACAREPGDRFPTAKAMAEALREAFSGVVSLPPSGVMSDSSGERNVNTATPRPDTGGGAISKRPPTPTELASTVNQDTPDPSLARSDAGSAVPAEVEPPKKNNSRMIGGIVLLAAAAAVVVALGMGRGPTQTGTPATTSTVSSTTSAKNAPPVEPSSTASTASTSASSSASSFASASPSASASASASVSPSSTPAGATPAKPALPAVAGKPAVAVKPAASTPKPEDSAKPAPKPSTPGGDILY
jgi:eukaryotic-like serine/threonine-protein kinase